MTINPRDYDLEELRRMARQDGPGDAAPDRGDPSADRDEAPRRSEGGDVADPLAAADPTGEGDRSGLYRELLPFLDETAEKPYLRALPATYAAELVVFEWLAYLTDRGGYHGAVDALEYYATLEWITDDVRADLAEYLRGIDGIDGADDGLDVDEHLRSLVYVAKLSAMG